MHPHRALGIALSAALVAGTAFAQTPRRTDPGVPPIPDLGSTANWEFVQIPGQAAASTLGNMAMRTTDGTLFVWSMHQEAALKSQAAPAADLPRRIDPSEPPNPYEAGPPGYPDATPPITVSTLYQWNGASWLPILVARDQTASSVYVGPLGDIYANTNVADGTMRVYHKYGKSWMVEPLPGGVVGPAGAFAGNGQVYMRTGNAILMHSGHAWVTVYACDEFKMGNGLFDLGNNQIIAPCEGHEHILNGTTWFTNVETLPTHVHSLWGGRDLNGVLHLFAGGSDPAHLQARIFEYVETQPGALAGQFQICMQDLPGTAGFINTVWGEQVHDVYATGVDRGVGQIYWFNGNGWVNAAPQSNLPATVGVVGSEENGLWVSLADGRPMHRPAVAAAVPLAEEAGGPSPPPIAPGSGAMTRVATLAVVGAPAAHATLQFTLTDTRNVSLSFFDLSGRRVDGIDAGRLAAGVHQLTWNANRFPDGIYFCRLEAGGVQAVTKVLVRN